MMTNLPPSQTPPPPPQGPPPPGGAMQPHRGTQILVFGILGLVCCVIFGIVAWSMGSKDMQEIRAGRMDPSGEGLTNAGKILGMVSVILAIVAVVINLIMLAVGAGTFFSAMG
jgi:hypothetical protein